MNRHPKQLEKHLRIPISRTPYSDGNHMKSPLRILHLEDDPNDAALVESLLESETLRCSIARVQSRVEFVRELEQEGVDLVISDFTVPGFNGLAALEAVRAKSVDLPFIFVSGTLGEET